MIHLQRFIHFLIIIILCRSCKPPIHSIEPYHIKLVEDNVYASFDNCNFTLKNPKVVINPYKTAIQNFVQPKPFASFCLKCAACLSIADEIANILKGVVASSAQNRNQIIIEHINSLCTKGFKNFDLRKYNENILITNKMSCTEHIRSNMDGGWTKKLREMCSLYTSYVDLDNVPNEFTNNAEELSKKLCRGTGIYRDCINVEHAEYEKILIEMSSCDKCACH